jgi:hypothetical protein
LVARLHEHRLKFVGPSARFSEERHLFGKGPHVREDFFEQFHDPGEPGPLSLPWLKPLST